MLTTVMMGRETLPTHHRSKLFPSLGVHTKHIQAREQPAERQTCLMLQRHW